MRGVFSQNIHIEDNIHASDEHLLKYHDKLRILDNMIELASQSLIVYFEKVSNKMNDIIDEISCRLVLAHGKCSSDCP